MLLGVNRIQGMKGLRVDRVAGHMLAPIIKGHTPWIGAMVGAKTSQSMETWFKTKPTAILLSDWTVGCLDLAMVKN